MGNDHLTEIQLIEIVIFQLIESFNNESFIFYHLTEFLDGFQLIKSFNNDFGQTPKFKAFDRIIRSTA